MARRRGPSRMDLRRANEASERTESDEEFEEDDELVDEEDLDDDSDDDDEDDADVDSDADTPDEDEEEEEVRPRKKKKVAAAKKPSRAKSTKKKVDSQRKRFIWGVFDNGMNMVASFPYPDRAGAVTKAEELTARGKGTYFVQPHKEPMPAEDEKKG